MIQSVQINCNKQNVIDD